MSYEVEYIDLVDQVIRHGERRESRAGPTRAKFGVSMRVPTLVYKKFPLLTTRHIYAAPIMGELAAFLVGAEELWVFHEYGCHYWDGNAEAWAGNKHKLVGEMRVGKVYGSKWRDFHHVDQLRVLVEGLTYDPKGRRHVLTCWDPSEKDQCLPPCHILSQFFVAEGRRLDVVVYMRSVDLCLGLPSDVVLYAGLLCLLAREVEADPGYITFFLGDAHVYENHVDQWEIQRLNPVGPSPNYTLDKEAGLFSFTPEYFQFPEYPNCPRVHYELNV